MWFGDGGGQGEGMGSGGLCCSMLGEMVGMGDRGWGSSSPWSNLRLGGCKWGLGGSNVPSRGLWAT